MRKSAASGRCLPRLFWFAVFALIISGPGCGPVKKTANAKTANVSSTPTNPQETKSNTVSGATIPVDAGGPADTVRVFYKHLRERRFREAVFLTNLRPAVEGLTDSELREFSLDFEKIAGRVPIVIEINGEIISGDLATVTANLPAEDEDKNEIQTIRLRSENGIWVILTVEPAAEARIKKEGKDYFYNLKIETHEEEARSMLERISKAQLAHSLQNGGDYADLAMLVKGGLLPEDAMTSDSTGYNYVIHLSSQKKRYSATATPAAYGKTGRLSFLLLQDEKGISRVTSSDNGGKPPAQ
jgi:hypothetical protein